jgi:hypothetical protein
VKAFDAVVVAGETISVAIGDDGITEVDSDAVTRLVRGFRGR